MTPIPGQIYYQEQQSSQSKSNTASVNDIQAHVCNRFRLTARRRASTVATTSAAAARAGTTTRATARTTARTSAGAGAGAGAVLAMLTNDDQGLNIFKFLLSNNTKIQT